MGLWGGVVGWGLVCALVLTGAKKYDLLPLLWPRSVAPVLRSTICCRCLGLEGWVGVRVGGWVGMKFNTYP